MANEGFDFAKELDLQELLDAHDYELPEVGDIRKGIIVSMSQQGIIVDLGLKRDGLVPPSDINKLDPAEREALKINDEIPVYVMDTEQQDSLEVSIYQARLEQDWIQAEEMQASGEVFEGEVVGYNQGGAIVEFGKLRGFIPASHLLEMKRGMNERQRQQKMSKLRGEKLPLKVIEVDRKRRRLVFSQRDAQKEWQESRKKELLENLSEGDTLKGRVSGLRPFGAFVDIGGADGLIHVSELAWHRVDHPSEVVKVGDEVEVYVLGLDKADQRIALSRKRLLPDPWTVAESKYDVSQLVEGTITRIVNYGAFVELEPGIEGLLHSSQLADRPVNDPHEIIKEGETHLLRIIKIDSDKQRIGLSLKAVTTSEQIDWMARRETEPEPAAKPARSRKPRSEEPATEPEEQVAPAEEPVAAVPVEEPVAQAEPEMQVEAEPQASVTAEVAMSEAAVESAAEVEAEAMPTEEAATEEAPAEDVPMTEAAVEEPAAVEEAPAAEIAVEESPAEEAAVEETAAEETAVEEPAAEEMAVEESPAEAPISEVDAAEESSNEEPPAGDAEDEEAPAE
jgi:small subunit ribosomal protein S1